MLLIFQIDRFLFCFYVFIFLFKKCIYLFILMDFIVINNFHYAFPGLEKSWFFVKIWNMNLNINLALKYFIVSRYFFDIAHLCKIYFFKVQ